jgi:hypothetical protein
MVVSTNQGVIRSVPRVFPFPPGDSRLRGVNRSQVSSANRYVPWITALDPGGVTYGDAACFIEFGTGPAKGGKIIYIWSTLLSGPQGPSLMADAVSWIVDAILRPPSANIHPLDWTNGVLVLGFQAHSNLDYSMQFRTNVSIGAWSILKDFGSSPADRSLFYTNSISGSQAGFFRLSLRP